MAPELKLNQTFTIILPNLIHKSKKRNLTRWIARRRRRRAGKPDGSRAKNFLPLKPLHFLPARRETNTGLFIKLSTDKGIDNIIRV